MQKDYTKGSRVSTGAPMVGSNPLIGAVDARDHFSFTVESYAGNAPLYFSGVVQYLPRGIFLKGNYCSIDRPGHCNKTIGDAGYFTVGPGY